MILHQFNQPGVLERHRQYLGTGDAILLIENAVFDHVLLDELELAEMYREPIERVAEEFIAPLAEG